ncbi:MAG: exodeoxyribonuclease VII large subunit [bacterium]|nr:exodeoxyribonuclease VII large subunit [bacterium]
MNQKIFTITEINNHLKDLVEKNQLTQNIWITGEISNLKIYQQGKQIYFTLSDSYARINCVIYASSLSNSRITPENGICVVVYGKIRFYQKKGSMTFQVNYMSLKGAGSQTKEFEKLKNKLFNEGLFDIKRKKEIPKYPDKAGIITAFDSAAMWDFITITKERAPHLKIFVIPAVMQGVSSPESIIKALETAKAYKDLDIILLIRGGGSSEDLSGFNQELVVRNIADFPLPIITGTGHEVDYTLCDFAADLRAPTPTAAAHLVTNNFVRLKSDIIEQVNNLSVLIRNMHSDYNNKITEICSRSYDLTSDKLKVNNNKMNNLFDRLKGCDPLLKLKQGYSICRFFESKTIIKSITQINKSSHIKTELQDGWFTSKINSLKAG